ncbi:hypothetical protein PCORN_14714 [Listeria cornellensis FSL F6-0969]|uniref:Uncharacterized protein n=1 Tax=Listeria cornellensis FSL F6-0969 TaxID=1265820 RepID=W7BNI8_9LIST|nr:hypothetical protein PCORN_14714 [Listeria cornellensis FSL F6-0969]
MNEQMQRSRAFIVQVQRIITKSTKTKYAEAHERKRITINEKKSPKNQHISKLSRSQMQSIS